MNRYKRLITFIMAGLVLLVTSGASAPWVFVGRKAIGKIERMTQPRTGDAPGYDLATVVIKGKTDKVYSTAVKAIESASKYHITRQDSAERIIDFTDGTHSAGIKISQVNDDIVHLLIVSVVSGQDSTTSLVLSGVMRVCKEMGANCSIE
jgi:hypothetical protein